LALLVGAVKQKLIDFALLVIWLDLQELYQRFYGSGVDERHIEAFCHFFVLNLQI
jgi:hypothetical protein